MPADFNLYLDLQQTVELDSIPEQQEIEYWIKTALAMENPAIEAGTELELTIRIVDKDEIQALNHTYRHKDKPTNVLSFPYEGFEFEVPEEIQLPLLGDLIICHDIVVQEAREQNKSLMAHWAHMVVHGVLHLKGYDHVQDKDAQQMESLEVRILRQLGYPNPYQ